LIDYFKGTGDLSIRYGFWPCRSRSKAGTVLLLNGRREFMEKYDETIGDLKCRCYDVYSMDWRGQGGSERLLANPQKGYINNYQQYIDDLDVLIEKIIRPCNAGPLIGLAHSMGGHILLRYLSTKPEAVERVIMTAPMFDIHIDSLSAVLLRRLIRLAMRLGLAHRYTIGSGDYAPDDRRFPGNRLTSDPERFLIERRAIGKNPDLALGGVTYGWLDATLQSIDALMDPATVAGISTPLLIISAADDKVVSNRAQQTLSGRIPGCELITLAGSRHEVLFETDPVRNRFWAEFDRFSTRR